MEFATKSSITADNTILGKRHIVTCESSDWLNHCYRLKVWQTVISKESDDVLATLATLATAKC
jgi:hypothetical protein